MVVAGDRVLDVRRIGVGARARLARVQHVDLARHGILEVLAVAGQERAHLGRVMGVAAVVLDAVVLGRQLERVHVGLDLHVLRVVPHGDEVRDGDGRQDTDDDDDDHQLDQGEAALVLTQETPPCRWP